ncbi:MAG: ankyrin repeat domain-containing protein [Vicinamibacterales bacterium]
MSIDELIEAAKAGDTAKVRSMLARDPSIGGARAASGETPLIAALYRGHADLASELADAVTAAGQQLDIFALAALGRTEALDAALSSGVSPDGYSYDGWTPLHLAAFFGRTASALRLLDAGAAVTAVSHNSLTNTPLHAATAGGHAALAVLLIQRGADVRAKDSGGHTPLHIAAESGLVPVVQALLARGADPHAVDAEDKTPLSRAAARNHVEVVDLINVRE